MFYISLLFMSSFLLVLLVKLISFLISESLTSSREELSSYECGFEFKTSSRIPFSLRYFFLTLIFLLFDLEVVFLMLLPFYFFISNIYFTSFLVAFILMILLFGVFYEWMDGTLDWVN